MPATHTQEICTRNLHEKFDASSSQFLAPKQLIRPITLHSSCHLWDSLCAVFYCVQEIVPEILVPDLPTHMQVSVTRQLELVTVSGTSFFSVCR